MDESRSTLVILLSMHRSGSSLTARILQKLGMSLGPFPLNGAAPSNPYGHYESVPFLLLNQKVQALAYGFRDDLPESAEVLSRFVASRGCWNDQLHIPDELLDEGRVLVEALVRSGPICGFKDPRTVLAWPFWRRVLESFPGLRVIRLGLVRSPHEIAMSLVSRRHGLLGYWDSLDVAGVHLGRIRAILAEDPGHLPCLCFWDGSYLRRLEEVAVACGLRWSANVALESIDGSCVHHEPAVVAHWAQEHFDALRAGSSASFDSAANLKQLERDARSIEQTRLTQLRKLQEESAQALERLSGEAQARRDAEAARDAALAQLDQHRLFIEDQQARLNEAQSQVGRLHADLQTANRELETVRQELDLLREQAHHWRTRLQRIESHPVVSLSLRSLRRLRQLLAERQAG